MLHRTPKTDGAIEGRTDRRWNGFSSSLLARAPVVAAAFLLGWPAGARAQDRPNEADLASIIEQLSAHHREGSRVEFVDIDPARSPSCRMNAAAMKVSRVTDSKSFPVLIDHHGGGSGVRQIFAKLGRISVDADGAGRAPRRGSVRRCSASRDQRATYLRARQFFPTPACGCFSPCG